MDYIAEYFMKKEYYHVFQPICSLPGRKHMGYEALLRNRSGITPDALFQSAMSKKNLPVLDTQSLLHAVSAFFQSSAAQENELLFANVFPSTIVAESFPLFIEEIVRGFKPFTHRIVFEINESVKEGEIWDRPVFMERIAFLRNQGFLIALDDVGEGTTTIRKILDISPDFIKMDRYFSENLSVSEKKQKVIRLFVEYCRNESHLILEGMEHKEDVACAVELGVKFGQGYALGKPRRLTEPEEAHG